MSIFEVLGILAFQALFGCVCFFAGCGFMFRNYRGAIKQAIAESVKENSPKPKDGGGL